MLNAACFRLKQLHSFLLQMHSGSVWRYCIKIGGCYFFSPPLLTQALEKMEQEWSTVEFDVLPYKETGTYILKSPDEASQLLDDHIVMTQSMSFSPFKKTFQGRINTWESKLRMTQVHTDTLA